MFSHHAGGRLVSREAQMGRLVSNYQIESSYIGEIQSLDNAEGSLRDPVETTRWTPFLTDDDIVRHSE